MSCQHGNWESQGCDECDEQTAIWNRAFNAGVEVGRAKAIVAILDAMKAKTYIYSDAMEAWDEALAAIRGEKVHDAHA
jgi:hypothetical protein